MNQEETSRRLSTTPHPLSCGIALHARLRSVGLLDQRGAVLVHRPRQTDPETFLKAMAPSRPGLVVAVAGRFPWYGLAARCADAGLPCVLGQALSRPASPGGTATPDPSDSPQMAAVLRGGRLPQAAVSPATRRATRAGLRRRRPLAHPRAALRAPVQHTHRPYPLPARGTQSADNAHRDGGAARCAAAAGHTRLAVELARLPSDAARRRDGARPSVTTAPPPDAHTRERRPTVPGSGTRLRRVRLDAIPEVHRFPSVQDGVASGRLVPWARAAAGTRDGTAGATIGPAHRPWAFAAAAVVCRSAHPAAQHDRARLETQQATGHALTLLAQQRARAVADRRTRPGAFERAQCCQRDTSREGSRCASGLTGPQGAAPHRGARPGGRPGVRARHGASRSPGPEPSAVLGPPLALLCSTARGAPGRRGRLLPRAGCSRDTGDAGRPLWASDGRRAPRHVAVAAHAQTRRCPRRPGGASTARRVGCRHGRAAPSSGNHVRTPDRLLTVPGSPRRKKRQTSALRSRVSLDKRGPHTCWAAWPWNRLPSLR
jgi:hypothetical protein